MNEMLKTNTFANKVRPFLLCINEFCYLILLKKICGRMMILKIDF